MISHLSRFIPPSVNPTNVGALGSAPDTESRCRVFVEWLNRGLGKHPEVNVRSRKDFEKLAHLLENENFTSIFGRNYDQVSQAGRAQIFNFGRTCRRVLAGEYRRTLSNFSGWLRFIFGDAVLNRRIRNVIKPAEETKVWAAISNSLQSGKLTTFSLPESNVVGSVTPIGKAEEKVVKQAILVDLARIPDATGKLVAKGTVHEANEQSAIYSGPSNGHSELGTLKPGERIHVFGQVIDQPWYLIGYGVEGEFGLEPMGYGYVHKPNFKELKPESDRSSSEFLALPNKATPKTAEFIEIDWIVTCSKAEFKLQKQGQDGVIKEVSLSCVGPMGIPISAS